MFASPGIVLLPLKSSNLRAAGHDPASARLVVAFHSSARYEYFQVPRIVFHQLLQARSPGGFFAGNIRDKYRCRRLA